ncbi:MAG: SH3 domain-containing protein [Clostridia bacterium]|nr:SH3 domain-containing protein [Clostridia bacterium]
MNKKILKINLCLIMLFIFISCTAQVFAAGSFSLSKSSSSITEGKKDSFTINGSNATGRVDITSSNTSVATVSSSSQWLENNSTTVTITAKKAGTAKITVSGTIADKDGNEATVTKTISVTVKAKSTSSSTNNKSNSNSTSNSGSTKREPKFTSVNQTMYTTGEVNIRKSYSTSSAIIKTVEKGTKITRVGIGDNGWSKITYNGQTAYISSSLLTKTKPAEDKPKTEEPKSNTTNQTTNNETINNENTNNTTEPVNNEVDNSNTDNTNAVLGLSKLEIAGVNFSEGFDPSIHSYTLKLNFFVKDLNITAEANKTDAKVEIIGNENFEAGENNVTILVSSADNKETATYQIKVTIPSEVASSPQNNIQFYLMCGTIILAAIVVIGIIVSIYKKKNKNEVDYKELKTDNDMIDPYTDIKPKKEKVKSGKHSN